GSTQAGSGCPPSARAKEAPQSGKRSVDGTGPAGRCPRRWHPPSPGCCGDDSDIDENGPAAADSFKLPFLEHSKEGDLGFRRKLGNFVQEKRAALSQLKSADAPLLRSRKGAFFMTKQFRRNQGGRDAGTVKGDERPARAS